MKLTSTFTIVNKKFKDIFQFQDLNIRNTKNQANKEVSRSLCVHRRRDLDSL